MFKILLSTLILTAFTVQLNAQVKPVRTTASEEAPKVAKITAEDFKKLASTLSDDKVVQYRIGNVHYTMIPVRDLKLSSERREAYTAAIEYGEKIAQTWLAKAYGITFEDQVGYMQAELERQSADKIKELFRQQGKEARMPSVRDILAVTQSAKEANEKLKDRSAFYVEIDELIESFEKFQDEIRYENSYDSDAAAIVPSAVLAYWNAKIPDSLIKKLSEIRYTKAVAPFLRGSLTISPVIRPWKRIARNLDTNEITEDTYLEFSALAWLVKDIKSTNQSWSNHHRLGLGVLWGDFGKMSDLTGFVTGYSRNFYSGRADGDVLPLHMNAKFGTITSTVSTLTQVMDWKNFFKHGYFTYGAQIGLTSTARSTGNAEVGGIFNLIDITNKININQDTLEELTKELISEIPGAEIIVHDNKIDIRIPKKTEIPAKPSSQTDVKGQENADVSPETKLQKKEIKE